MAARLNNESRTKQSTETFCFDLVVGLLPLVPLMRTTSLLFLLICALELRQNGGAGSTAQAPSSSSKGSNTSSVSGLSSLGRGKACGLYIWDVASAFLFRWCTHLQKDCIYDGRGGQKVSDLIHKLYKKSGSQRRSMSMSDQGPCSGSCIHALDTTLIAA